VKGMSGYSSMYDGLEAAKKDSAKPTKASATSEAAPKKSILKRADAAPPAAAGYAADDKLAVSLSLLVSPSTRFVHPCSLVPLPRSAWEAL
jgi:hypothetical protein